MKTTLFILALGFILCTSAGYSYAQPEEGERPLKKIQQFKKMKLLELLDMEEAAANAFLVKYDKWQKDIMQLTQKRNDLAADMKIAMEKKAGDAEINTLLDGLADVSKRLEEMKFAMFADLRTVLTPRQAVKLAVFEMQFQKKLHDSIDRLRDRGRDHQRGPGLRGE